MLHKKQKALTKTDLTPGPSPMGRGEHASQKTKKTKDLQGKDGFGGDGPESGDHFDGDRIGEKE